MSHPFTAVVSGKRCLLKWSAEQENTLLVDGVPHAVESMNRSNEVLRGQRILRLCQLQYRDGTSNVGSGMWLLDGSVPGHYECDEKLKSKKMTAHVLDRILHGKEHPFENEQFPSVTELKAHAVAIVFVTELKKSFSDGTKIGIPIFLSKFTRINDETPGNHMNAANTAEKKIRAVTLELRATIERLEEVAQPFHEMYKDPRLAGAKAEALKAGIPELVVDEIVSIYLKFKMPTTDGLMKSANTGGITTKLEAGGRGTSRSSFGRWLADFKKILRRRGVIQGVSINPKSAQKQQAVICAKADASDQTAADTRAQELPEGSDGDG